MPYVKYIFYNKLVLNFRNCKKDFIIQVINKFDSEFTKFDSEVMNKYRYFAYQYDDTFHYMHYSDNANNLLNDIEDNYNISFDDSIITIFFLRNIEIAKNFIYYKGKLSIAPNKTYKLSKQDIYDMGYKTVFIPNIRLIYSYSITNYIPIVYYRNHLVYDNLLRRKARIKFGINYNTKSTLVTHLKTIRPNYKVQKYKVYVKIKSKYKKFSKWLLFR